MQQHGRREGEENGTSARGETMESKPSPWTRFCNTEWKSPVSDVRLPDCAHQAIPAPETNAVYPIHQSGVTNNIGQQGRHHPVQDRQLITA